MKGFVDDIEALTVENSDFRRVLYTGKHLQLVLMTLKPGEEIGAEVHEDRDQFFRVESGTGAVE
ncbi:MAG TPA: cupin domain-containing protein, partial [Casimicrobiaceae bacterium]|nr:cupin domain-containing protein [Casimicrobiaceae bacterium]